MKTRLVNLWKNTVEFVSMMFGFGAIVAITAIAMVVVSVVSNFMADHQWVILIFDLTCVLLLTMAICYRLDINFQKPKGKWLFWLLFSNVLILIIQSFGALWNFIIILFLLWPSAVVISQLIKKTFRNFWWLVDKWKVFIYLISLIVVIYLWFCVDLTTNVEMILAILLLFIFIFLVITHIIRLRKQI